MIVFENQCVDCGLPCIGDSCMYKNVKVCYCDTCGSDAAIYNVDDADFCEECLRKYLQESFSDLLIEEQAQILNIPLLNI